MNPWSIYNERMAVRGANTRDAALRREKLLIEKRLRGSLSFHHAVIDNEERDLAIIDSDNLNIKSLIALPGEDLPHGGMVEWMDNHWLITEKDANSEVCVKAKMKQCNYLLRWITSDDIIIERWCIIEDGTKLKYVTTYDSLAYWKRYAKRIPLIAGNPLEPYRPQHNNETSVSARV